MRETIIDRTVRLWHEFCEAIRIKTDGALPSVPQHRASTSRMAGALQCIADGKSVDPLRFERRSARNPFASNRDNLKEWFQRLPEACTNTSIRAGTPRLRDDVPMITTQHFVELSQQLDKTLLEEATNIASKLAGNRSGAAMAEAVGEAECALLDTELREAMAREKTASATFGADAPSTSRPSNFKTIRVEAPWGPSLDEPIDGEVLTVHRHVTRDKATRPLRRPGGASNIGTEPEHWDRYTEDMQVFKSKRPGGTVLIDCSGSMSWDWDDLRTRIRKFPAATVAVYSGTNNKGQLCVIAEKGRWSDFDSSEMKGGNEVDIEALEWLVEQKGPLVWLSDARICGGQVERIGRGAAAAKVLRICTDARVTRATTIDAALETLAHPTRSSPDTFTTKDAQFVPDKMSLLGIGL